uniref:Orn/Lys/Arg decarboxylases family 1 pyridoxal-P attachment site domain-containing protein n=1 Tax=Ananas comosus var. bracteatus TaxID=296719 RepID=A0A6V7QTA1_ANACO
MASPSSSSTSRWNPVIKPQPSDKETRRFPCKFFYRQTAPAGILFRRADLLLLLASGSTNRQRYKSAMCDFFIEHAYDLECRDATRGFSNCCERKQRPLVQALKSAAQQAVSCFHFPGHNRGKAAPSSMSSLTGLGTFVHDLPELPELDDLFSPSGAILDAQRKASELFGSSRTWFLVNGTTCGIQASIMASCSQAKHLSYLGILIFRLYRVWFYPVLYQSISRRPFRVSPRVPRTALEQGADLAVQSSHKVLSSLTQSSMLHSKGELVDADRVSRCLQMLQSSSPSYLLLASLDAARAQLSDNPEIFGKALDMSAEAKKHLSLIPGISVLGLSSFDSAFPAIDPLRITVGFSRLNISGYVADEIVSSEHHIVCELVGTRSQTFAVNLGTRKEDIQRLVLSMKHLSSDFYQANEGKTSLKSGVCAPLGTSSMQLTPRDAFFAKKRKVLIGESLGKICGELICPYPPGIPVLVPGEVITEDALSYLLDVRNMGAGISGAADDKLSSMLVCDF